MVYVNIKLIRPDFIRFVALLNLCDGSAARLVIRWRESGGPAVRPEEATGYGSELIETGLKEQIGATGSMTLEAGGVAVSLVLPLATGLVLRPGSGAGNDRG